MIYNNSKLYVTHSSVEIFDLNLALYKGGFPFSAFCRAIDFCDRFLLNCEPSTGSVPVEGSQFKRKLSQKVDRATKSTEWKSSFIPCLYTNWKLVYISSNM